MQSLNLAAATSTELSEALNGDRIEPLTIEEARLDYYWAARFFMVQWNFGLIRRGLVAPAAGGSRAAGEARMASRLLSYFNDFRTVEGWWEAAKHTSFAPDFIEWVEEQRSKAA